MAEMKEMMRRYMMKGGQQQVKSCGICYDMMHPTDACPTPQDPTAEVNSIGGYDPSRPRYDPYSNTYNPGWRDHPKLRYRN